MQARDDVHGHASTDTPIARLLQRATPVSEISFDDCVLDYDITHRELVELFGLQPRHLRVFTQQRSLTGIFPYDDMVVFKFEHLKGLLFWDKIMVPTRRPLSRAPPLSRRPRPTVFPSPRNLKTTLCSCRRSPA